MRSTHGRLTTVRQGPDHLPMLDRGAHRSPEHGACLMEYVSVLAGTPFSDRPNCTHPALALVARWVNDHTTDPAARARLAVLAPGLIGTRSADPRLTLTVVACCLRAAVTARPQDRYLQWLLRRTEAQLARWERPWARWWARWLGTVWEPTAWSRLGTPALGPAPREWRARTAPRRSTARTARASDHRLPRAAQPATELDGGASVLAGSRGVRCPDGNLASQLAHRPLVWPLGFTAIPALVWVFGTAHGGIARP
jgi:hypothetical protein